MDVEQNIKNLVIARLEVLSENIGISIGSLGNFSKEELICHVRNGDEVGQKIIEVEMDFLRGLKQGNFYGKENPSGDAA